MVSERIEDSLAAVDRTTNPGIREYWEAFAPLFYPDYDPQTFAEDFAGLSERTFGQIDHGALPPDLLISKLRELFSATPGGIRYSKTIASETIRPDRVVSRQEGSCVGQALVCQLLAELHGVPCRIVLRPNPYHAVIALDGAYLNPALRLRDIAGAEVATWREVGDAHAFGRALSPREILCLLVTVDAWESMIEIEQLGGTPTRMRLARERIDAALSLNRSEPSACSALAFWSAMSGDYEAAVVQQERAAAINPLPPFNWLVLALWKDHLGDAAGAKTALAEARSRGATDEQIQEHFKGRAIPLIELQDAE